MEPWKPRKRARPPRHCGKPPPWKRRTVLSFSPSAQIDLCQTWGKKSQIKQEVALQRLTAASASARARPEAPPPNWMRCSRGCQLTQKCAESTCALAQTQRRPGHWRPDSRAASERLRLTGAALAAGCCHGDPSTCCQRRWGVWGLQQVELIAEPPQTRAALWKSCFPPPFFSRTR